MRLGLASVVDLDLIEIVMSEAVENRNAQSCRVEAVAKIHISDWNFDSQPRKGCQKDTTRFEPENARCYKLRMWT